MRKNLSPIEVTEFLKNNNISLTLEQRKFFVELNKFCLELQYKLVLKYNVFLLENPQITFAGGCIRDLLLLGKNSIKDLDLIINCSLANHSKSALLDDLIKLPAFIKIFEQENTQHKTIDTINLTEAADLLKLFYDYDSNITSSDIIIKFLIQTFITENYDNVDLRFSHSKELVRKPPSAINNSVQSQEEEYEKEKLIGVIKTQALDFNLDILLVSDALLTQENNYIAQTFDIGLCLISWPINYLSAISLSHKTVSTAENKEEIKSHIQNNLNLLLEDLTYIENNIDKDYIFYPFLAHNISIFEAFSLSYSNKVHIFLLNKEKDLTDTFGPIKNPKIQQDVHFLRLYQKYPFPLLISPYLHEDKHLLQYIQDNGITLKDGTPIPIVW